MNYKRILLKISGEALLGEDGIFNFEVLSDLKQQVGELVSRGIQVAIVVGGGNIFRGDMIIGKGMEESKGHYMGMIATMINSVGLTTYFNEHGLKTIMQSALPVLKELGTKINRESAIEALENGSVVIFGGGTGRPFVTTDSGAAERAQDIKAEAVIIAKNGVDGVYTDDPKINPSATHLSEITFSEIMEKKLKVIDLEAAETFKEMGVNVILFNMNIKGNIVKLWDNPQVKKTIIK